MAMASSRRQLRTRLLNILRAPMKVQAVDSLLARATQGRAPESLLARIPPLNDLYPKPSPRRVTRNGIAYDLDISDFVEWVIYYGIATEPREKLFGLAKAGDTVVDVGANVGETVMNFARRVGPAGRVLAFEPGPVVRAKLERNVSLNSFANIEIFPLGLGDVEATLQLSVPAPFNRGGNRIMENPIGDHVAVRVVPLDAVLAQRGIERVDVMKVDVEGFELRLLRGAQKTLERCRPKLFVEVSDELLRGSGTSASELLRYLADLGYRLSRAEDAATVSPDDRFEGTHFDVIATPR